MAQQQVEQKPRHMECTTAGFNRGCYYILEIHLERAAEKLIWPQKREVVKRLEKGTPAAYNGTLDGVFQSAKKALQVCAALKQAATVVASYIEVPLEASTTADSTLVTSDEALRTCLAEQQVPPGAQHRIRIFLGAPVTKQTARSASCQEALQNGKKGNYTTCDDYLRKLRNNLQDLANDFWRGMIEIIGISTTRCRYCGKRNRQPPTRSPAHTGTPALPCPGGSAFEGIAEQGKCPGCP